MVVGLGNPGPEYEETRHNIGFKVLDSLSGASGTFFSVCRHGWSAEWRLKGRSIRLLKPNTYMNLSGKAVRFHLQDLKIETERLLVITDDLALPFGKLRLRAQGSDGGHNGLKSIEAELGTRAFARLRFGIGSEFGRGGQVDYVLGEWGSEERSSMPAAIDRAGLCVQSFVLEGLSNAMSRYNAAG